MNDHADTTHTTDTTDTTEAAVRAELAVAAAEPASSFATADRDALLTADLGIDSLALLELVARLEYRLGIAVPDEDFARLTSIAAVVHYLDHARVPS